MKNIKKLKIAVYAISKNEEQLGRKFRDVTAQTGFPWEITWPTQP
jgi:hypothetical protein